MIKQKAGVSLGAILLLTFNLLWADDSDKQILDTWKLAKTEDNISIYYRWIDMDTLKAREMRALFSIDADVDAVISQFSNATNYASWAAGIKECKIYEVDNLNWVSYTVMDYPWPFKERDMVAKWQMIKNENEVILNVFAENDFMEENPKMERIKDYHGEWKFGRGKTGETLVEYRVVSYTKPIFPRFIQDPVIQDMMIESFRDLIQLAESK